ncbi:MAG: hypothetical protein ABF289_18095 [Clostridiales bacterium]
MENERISFLVSKKLKENFIKSCDGRTMTNVLIKLMEGYVDDRDIPNSKQTKR